MIHDIQFHGNWKRPGNRYSELDFKILTNAKAQHRLIDKYKNCGVDFKFHFCKSPKSSNHYFEGFKSPEWIKTHFGLDIQPDDDKISVIIVGNAGTPKYPLTPWIIAHRMSHAMFRNIGYQTHQHSMNQMTNLLGQDTLYSKWFGCAIGTTRSCRQRTLAITREIYHELFAQCLLTGRIRLKHIENRVLHRMRGRNKEYKYFSNDAVNNINRLIDRIENEVYCVKTNFDSACGEILVV